MSQSGLPVNVMLLTNTLQVVPQGGRALLSKLNHDVLKQVLGERLLVYELSTRSIRGASEMLNAFRGHIDGITHASLAAIVHTIHVGAIKKVMVDGSNLGAAVFAVKRCCPGVEISTFFHNCETMFFLDAFRRSRSVHSLGVLIANYLAERRAVRFSDKLVCLSERDSASLHSFFGRRATHISAMALQDQSDTPMSSVQGTERYALFVGGAFYANRAGIAWFVENVAPRIAIKIRIVGKGFEAMRIQLERFPNVEVIGAVENLASWYQGADFVVAPIFEGSGMKTKVAEALMFGKMVVGTPEAFSGYEEVASRVGAICSTPDEFVAAIERTLSKPIQRLDPGLRAIYEERYSLPAARARVSEIMGLV